MKKTFDAVAWMRARREQIEREDIGLTWDQKRLKTRKLLENDPIWLRLRHRLVSEGGPVLASGEHTDTRRGQAGIR